MVIEFQGFDVIARKGRGEMSRTVAIGLQSFSDIREGNYFYVDKTLFMKEWWESGDSVTLITRPRRFGKTLTMSMVEQFFSIDYEGKGSLFEGLSIWEDEEYRNLQGMYPVISLSFANIKESSYYATKMQIFQTIVALYNKYYFLLESNILTESEKEYFLSITMEMEEFVASMAIHKLSEFLSRYYEKKVIILLDEYDTPMQEAYVYGYWEELVSFIRNLFNSTFKTNPYLERAIMTGITRVSKESIFSDLNHLEVVTTTSDKYATMFGFTEAEVFQSLEEYGLGAEQQYVKEWYNGFTFGEHTDIYNPWSILNFLDKKKYDAYWANTSSNRLVSKLLREGNRHIKTELETLLNRESIQCAIEEQLIYSVLDENETAIWSLLLASGYLKVVEKEETKIAGRRKKYTLALTNGEVFDMFVGMVHDWFGKTESTYHDFIKAMFRGNRKEMNIYMNYMTKNIFSYFDTGTKEPERFYHGFVLGLLTELMEDYYLTSNRESGYGRYDVMLEPKDKTKEAFLLEFKVYDGDEEESLQDTVKEALRQIEEKQYETVLLAKGFAREQIRKYGFAFQGKKVLIG